MKKLFVFFTLVSCLTSCHKSLSDQAAQEALDFTRKYCPTPVKDFERTDSMTFDRDTKTFVYWKTLFGKADNKELIKKNKTKLHDAILLSVRNNHLPICFPLRTKRPKRTIRYEFWPKRLQQMIFASR